MGIQVDITDRLWLIDDEFRVFLLPKTLEMIKTHELEFPFFTAPSISWNDCCELATLPTLMRQAIKIEMDHQLKQTNSKLNLFLSPVAVALTLLFLANRDAENPPCFPMIFRSRNHGVCTSILVYLRVSLNYSG